jgi:hypothetical protein
MRRSAIPIGEVRKRLSKVPVGEGIRVIGSFDRLKLGPSQQGIGGNYPLAYLASFLGNDFASFGEFLSVRQEKIQIEAARRIEDIHRCAQMLSFS